MFCFISVKKIKPGAVERYREVTRPRELPPGFVWGYNLRDLANENTIVSIALVDRPVEFFTEQMSEDDDFVKEMQRRAEAMEPLVDEVVLHGVFEVVDELKDEEF
jgi:alpha-D-ribose 1-methylphosphonate 5-triphosphate synthase subunit PhnI